MMIGTAKADAEDGTSDGIQEACLQRNGQSCLQRQVLPKRELCKLCENKNLKQVQEKTRSCLSYCSCFANWQMVMREEERD